MLYLYTVIAIILLIILYPIRIIIYTENKFVYQIVILGFIRIPINIRKMIFNFSTRNEEHDIDIIEIAENIKKIYSVKDFFQDLSKKAVVKHFYWYSAVPMENPLFGLSILPIYATAQNIIIDTLKTNFKKVKDIDVDVKYNYLTNDTFLYIDCIISTNVTKIITVSLKYIKKWPLLFKRAT